MEFRPWGFSRRNDERKATPGENGLAILPRIVSLVALAIPCVSLCSEDARSEEPVANLPSDRPFGFSNKLPVQPNSRARVFIIATNFPTEPPV